jgi:hypothetical protein
VNVIFFIEYTIFSLYAPTPPFFRHTISMLDFLRSIIALDSPIRVMYHSLRGFFAFWLSGNPAKDMIVI